MNATVVNVCTQVDGIHRDWAYPEALESLVGFIESLDELFGVDGKITPQAKECAENTLNPDTLAYDCLLLPVDEDRDLRVELKRANG